MSSLHLLGKTSFLEEAWPLPLNLVKHLQMYRNFCFEAAPLVHLVSRSVPDLENRYLEPSREGLRCRGFYQCVLEGKALKEPVVEGLDPGSRLDREGRV